MTNKKHLDFYEVKRLGWSYCVSEITADMLRGVETIKYTAFMGSNIKSIEIPDSVKCIEAGAFEGCRDLVSVKLPHGIKKIDTNTFYLCTNLKSIIIPDGVVSIGRDAFRSCGKLESVVIPDSVVSIEAYAFFDCKSLQSLSIPQSVERIGGGAFSGCKGLKHFSLHGVEYKRRRLMNGKCKAYKAFNADMTCFGGFLYKETHTYRKTRAVLCSSGFHACTNFWDVFNYYYGRLGKDVHIHEVVLDGVPDNDDIDPWDSKKVAKKITIGKRII